MPDQNQVMVAKEVLMEEMRYILKFLLDQARAGTRLRLSDVRGQLSKKLTLDFADYFKFLKRYNYVTINRTDHALSVTEEGRVIGDLENEKTLYQEMKTHFGRMLQDTDELIELDEDPSFSASRGDVDAGRYNSKAQIAQASSRSEQTPQRAESATGAQQAGAKFDARYMRYEAIGTGGIGTVYKGRHTALVLDVAIKEIKDLFTYFNFLQRSEVIRHLKEVVGQMAVIQHPGVIKIIDQNVEVAHPYFVMEFLSGGNLRQLMSGGRVALDRALVLFCQICYALKSAHRNTVIHGNLKPENVLLDTQGNARVTDFGMTKLLQTDSDRPIPRVVTGAIGYLAPEQMAHPSVVSERSDIYSLGILLYELLTGNLPGRRSPLPSEVNTDAPKPLDEIFDKMTRDRAEDRYSGIDELLADFYRVFDDGRFLGDGRMIMYSATPD